jgi:hypothetical protein
MLGTTIIPRTMTLKRVIDRHGNQWQYNSRSDAHGKTACWAILLDLLAHCSLLRNHVSAGLVGFGINHEMHDFRVKRKKDLDLVICRPGSSKDARSEPLSMLVRKHGVVLDESEQGLLENLPEIYERPVGTVLLALEAKACMTAHQKARPRLYDELSSSYQTIHGDTGSAIAAGFVTINVASTFMSSVSNPFSLKDRSPVVNSHVQPKDAREVIDKVSELPRRSNEDEKGFDALGIMLLDCKNDGSEVKTVMPEDLGLEISKILRYETMIDRISHLYSVKFKNL